MSVACPDPTGFDGYCENPGPEEYPPLESPVRILLTHRLREIEKPNFVVGIRRAAATWSDVIPSRFKLDCCGKLSRPEVASLSGMRHGRIGVEFRVPIDDSVPDIGPKMDPKHLAVSPSYVDSTGRRKVQMILAIDHEEFPGEKFAIMVGEGGNQYDIETIVLHEFGHWLPLSNDNRPTTESVMINPARPGKIRRDLSDDDRECLVCIYGDHHCEMLRPVASPDLSP